MLLLLMSLLVSLLPPIVSALQGQLKSYHNPIIPGFAPDPSCTRVEDNFFCVTSSFSAFPGLPVYTSRDLTQWEQIGNVFSRPSQLPEFSQANMSTGGLWTATIRYNKGTFYVTNTLTLDGKPLSDSGRWTNVIASTLTVKRPHTISI